MSASKQSPSPPRHEEGVWAAPVNKLDVEGHPSGLMNIHVEGRRLMSPMQGFGQMWQKTYRIRLDGAAVSPQEAIADWKAHYPAYWPAGNTFYAPQHDIEVGEVAVLNLKGPANLPLATGVRVIYSDDDSFAFMTPQGHMFAGVITYSAFEEQGATVLQIQALIRASDPVYEASFRLGFGHKAEDAFWFDTLRNLAAHLGAPDAEPEVSAVCIDPRVQWSEAGNVWYNAAIRSGLYMPVFLAKRLLGRA